MAKVKYRPIPTLSDMDKSRFWGKVDIRGSGECWPWKAGQRNWYGSIGILTDGKVRVYVATRVAYTITFSDPGELNVLHTCDNPPCCNPAHLFLGTHSDNLQDAISKGRAILDAKRKMTDELALEIRDRYLSSSTITERDLSEEYGISFNAIGEMIRGNSYRHLPPYTGVVSPRDKNYGAKIDKETAESIRAMRSNGVMVSVILDTFKISKTNFYRIINRQLWK